MAFEDRAERRLIERLARRDPAAVRELYALHGRTTFGFLLRLLDDRAAAEDVQQQVFLEAWQHGDRFDPSRGNLVAWLLTIARSRAVDHLRRRVPEPRDPAATVTLADGAEATRIDELLEQWRLVGVLDQLPPEEAELLRRRFYLEQSQTEIAEATGMPLGTVKTRMTRALRHMRELLEGGS
ncbi:sigma-70 family RNA polymerase sigma factor [Solirubrobacter phytolaccae]|uniref:Sigma-70 family RNA polymerase sigma factor n=1 Tax=Solirubrobacter phytolaccae TaxID=1404360 RepID=A0A9X3NDB1_9ACTN|nr:sigma-70 family RNA polymerase sigma factor [Solirubrobacter phytolaccae]MDA0183084.1 sigma-70 family RNA polymerase sigma factor [Solirubrobacter phytolaccae]